MSADVKALRILHTSDWHIGRTLYGKARLEEFEKFLSWLSDTIESEEVEALIVAGDIFDSSAPGSRAQELYYKFLWRISQSKTCRHAVFIAGNHDSPTLLNAPKDILRYLNVYVIGSADGSLEDHVIVLKDKEGEPELIVCAAPYLRDRDMRTAEAGESFADKERKLAEGIRAHYKTLCTAAEEKRHEYGLQIPIVATGHLFTAGGVTIEGDGVRELYIGSLARIATDIFPECIDYLALGHLHSSQTAGASEKMRYSGSPLPMSFSDAAQKKSVCIIDFAEAGQPPAVRLLNVPVFQPLERISGDWEIVSTRLKELRETESSAWLEIICSGIESPEALMERIENATEGSALTVINVRKSASAEAALSQMRENESLDDLSPDDVFKRLLDAEESPDDLRQTLAPAFAEVLRTVHEKDKSTEQTIL